MIASLNCLVSGDEDLSKKQDVPDFLVTALVTGGSSLFLLMMAIVVSCIIHTKRLKGLLSSTFTDYFRERLFANNLLRK